MDNAKQLPGQSANALVRPAEVVYRDHELPAQVVDRKVDP